MPADACECGGLRGTLACGSSGRLCAAVIVAGVLDGRGQLATEEVVRTGPTVEMAGISTPSMAVSLLAEMAA